jgi:uncharacterized protein YceK
MRKALVATAVCAWLCGGCATTATIFGADDHGSGYDDSVLFGPFSGVRLDGRLLGRALRYGGSYGGPYYLSALDMPFSLALDIVVLPVSIPVAIVRGGVSRETPPPEPVKEPADRAGS